jgi:diguanylate cyclase (GGDEF)-like protein
MEEIVNQIADLCGLRDRYALDDAMVRLVYLSGKGVITAVRVLRDVGDADNVHCLTRAEFDAKKMSPERVAAWKDWRELPALSDYPARIEAHTQRTTVQVAGTPGTPCLTVLPVGDAAPVENLLEIESAKPLPESLLRGVEGLMRVYSNLESLLDYGEKDALTGLLNRKTFDGAFLKAAVEMNTPDELGPADRRSAHSEDGYWLAVMDIDHFKRVNDNFGHLIGDEVLLLMARLMRASFRFYDQLYRFGGEEFVILMRCATPGDAAGAVERFRLRVQEHLFPQVDHITVSVGYTALRDNDTPGSAFDRADKAVYYAKAHGRNQVVSYQSLVDSGELVEEVKANQEVDFF